MQWYTHTTEHLVRWLTVCDLCVCRVHPALQAMQQPTDHIQSLCLWLQPERKREPSCPLPNQPRQDWRGEAHINICVACCVFVQGTRYGWLTTCEETWALCVDDGGRLLVSDAYQTDARDPSVRQLIL